MTSKNKLFKSFLLILICVLCLSSVSLVSAAESEDADIGVADVENATSIMTYDDMGDVDETETAVNNFTTLEEVGAYIRNQMVHRNVSFDVSITLPYDTYMDADWGDNGNKYFMDEALKHTAKANEGDYIAYSFSRYTVGRHATYDSTNDTITLYHSYQFTYYNSTDEEAYVTAQIPGILEEAGIAINMTNLEKTKRLSQWMIDNVTYSVTAEDATLKYSPYGAVHNGRAVCQGYSLLAYRLFMAAGVDCRLITGTVNGNNHAWILAEMDNGKYYNMDIMYEDTFATVVSSKPFKYLYKGSNNFGDFYNHVYVRGNTIDFKCSLFDYDTAKFDATYPTDTNDYTAAFAGTIESISPPVPVPDNYQLEIDLKTAMNRNGDIIFTINPSGGSGPVDSPVLIHGEEHPRFKYLVTDVMIFENDEWRPVSVASKYLFSDSNTSAFLLPLLETFKITVSIQDYGVTPMQTITNMYTLTVPNNEHTNSALSDKLVTILEGCADFTSDYDKALYLHDWILANATWDNSERNIALEGVLLKGTGNAESYARAYQYLLSQCDITSYLVVDTNNIGLESDSVWICAQLDDKWTFIDIFKDDAKSNVSVTDQHIYFGLNKDMLNQLHVSYQAAPNHLAAASAIEAATSSEHNYYIQNGLIETLSLPYHTQITELVQQTATTFTSIPVESHNNNDIYTLYYPMIADYLNSMSYSKNVTVVYNAKKNTMDVTITDINHDFHNLTYSGAKAPTCEEPGWTTQIYCNTCQVLVAESTQIKENGHDWDYYHKCKTCGKFDTTPGNLIYYGAKDDPVRAEYKIVDDNSVQYYKCKAVEEMTDVKVADYIKIGGKVYYVTSMNPNCFADRKDLTSVHVGENITSIGAGVFKDQTELVKVTGFTKVKNIYSKAFYNCTKLQQVGDIANVVNLPLVTEIRAETFFKCRAITTVYGMNKVFSIGDRAFYGCNQLVQIGNTAKCLTLPSISKIGKEAFRYCTSIKTIYSYSTQLATIGIGAFQDCSNLYSVKISSDKLASVGSDAFKGIASKATFLVHTQNLDSYKLLFSSKVGFKSTMTIKGY